MKLFMVIYFAGQVAGSVGPLPYGIEECRQRSADILAHGNKDVTTSEGIRLNDVKFDCQFLNERPTISERWNK